jgi:hypothetical protein
MHGGACTWRSRSAAAAAFWRSAASFLSAAARAAACFFASAAAFFASACACRAAARSGLAAPPPPPNENIEPRAGEADWLPRTDMDDWARTNIDPRAAGDCDRAAGAAPASTTVYFWSAKITCAHRPPNPPREIASASALHCEPRRASQAGSWVEGG